MHVAPFGSDTSHIFLFLFTGIGARGGLGFVVIMLEVYAVYAGMVVAALVYNPVATALVIVMVLGAYTLWNYIFGTPQRGQPIVLVWFAWYLHTKYYPAAFAETTLRVVSGASNVYIVFLTCFIWWKVESNTDFSTQASVLGIIVFTLCPVSPSENTFLRILLRTALYTTMCSLWTFYLSLWKKHTSKPHPTLVLLCSVWVLFLSLEMLTAPFFGWIGYRVYDLMSSQDTVLPASQSQVAAPAPVQAATASTPYPNPYARTKRPLHRTDEDPFINRFRSIEIDSTSVPTTRLNVLPLHCED